MLGRIGSTVRKFLENKKKQLNITVTMSYSRVTDGRFSRNALQPNSGVDIQVAFGAIEQKLIRFRNENSLWTKCRAILTCQSK